MQYVDVDGLDSNDGKTWATAKCSIEAAHGDLTDAWPVRGGAIHVSEGVYPIAEVDISKQNVRIQGASIGSTVLTPEGDFGLRVSGHHFTMSDVKITGQPANSFEGRAVDISEAQFATIERVWFHELSDHWTGTDDIDEAPAAIYVRGDDKFSDWHKFSKLDVWNCYRGVVQAGNANFTLTESTFRSGVAEQLYVLRRNTGSAGAGGGTAFVADAWFGSYSLDEGRYLVRLDNDGSAPNALTNTYLANCVTELGHANRNHVFCNQRDVRVVNHKFIGGGEDSVAIRFGPDSRDCALDVYRRVGSGAGLPVIVDDGVNNFVREAAGGL